VEKHCIAEQATGDNMANAHCMLWLHEGASMLRYTNIACLFLLFQGLIGV